jgi:hypothetical protein
MTQVAALKTAMAPRGFSGPADQSDAPSANIETTQYGARLATFDRTLDAATTELSHSSVKVTITIEWLIPSSRNGCMG